MGRACGRYGRVEKFTQNVVGKSEGKRPFGRCRY